MTQLAWIGLGNIGHGMAKNLVGKGNLERPLLLYNRTIKKAHDLSAVLPDGKSIVSSSIEDIVSKSDIIFICLGDDTAVKNTINTALTVSVEGKIFVDCSTTHPNNIKEIARQIEDKGAEFVACPVFGAQPVAEAGQLICVLAGPAAEKINPFLTGVVGRLTIDLSGQAAEKAALLKLIGNTFVMSQVEALGQGHTLAEKTGLGVENLHKFIEAFLTPWDAMYSNRMTSGDYHKREFPLVGIDLALKDIGHVLELARTAGTKTGSLETALGHLQAVKKYQGERGDLAGVYGAVRQEAGLSYEN